MASISIIVPIYNSERYLRECLNSIVSQSFTDFEVICVNDCSTDSCKEIIDEFACADSRIKVVSHDKRIGAANTRNHGMRYASSEYIIFWDADEIYEVDLLNKFYEAAVKYDADIVLAERGIIKGGLENLMPEASKKYQFDGYDKKCFSLCDLPHNGLLMWSSSPINRMIKRSLLIDNHLEYQDLQSSNDVLIADMMMILAKRVIHIADWEPKILVRRNVPGSISVNRNPFCSYEAFREIERQLIVRGLWDKYKKYIWYQFISTVSSELNRCNDEEVRERYYEFLKTGALAEICGEEGISFILFCTPLGSFLSELFEQTYEARCWEKSMFWRKLEGNRERLSKMIEFFKKNSTKVTLWGAGKWGKELIKFMQENFEYKFDYIVDNNTELVGKYIFSNKIFPFNEIKNETSLVVITNEAYKEDIKKQIRQEDVEVGLFVLPRYLGEHLLQCIE